MVQVVWRCRSICSLQLEKILGCDSSAMLHCFFLVVFFSRQKWLIIRNWIATAPNNPLWLYFFVIQESWWNFSERSSTSEFTHMVMHLQDLNIPFNRFFHPACRKHLKPHKCRVLQRLVITHHSWRLSNCHRSRWRRSNTHRKRQWLVGLDMGVNSGVPIHLIHCSNEAPIWVVTSLTSHCRLFVASAWIKNSQSWDTCQCVLGQHCNYMQA